MTTTMRAIIAERPGGPEVLKPAKVERPTPGATEILVRVHAAGINPTDWKSRSGGGLAGRTFPLILGYDVAGVVEAVGPGVTLYRPGDEVLGMPLFPHLPGAYAEYVVAPSRHFVPKPAALSFEEAAGLPLVALTAWQGLVDTGKVKPGQRVLIHAAAGGVGHVAVQIAKSLGAYVIGTASAAKHDFVRGLGADEVIDYHEADFADVLRDQPVDVVFDPIAGDYSSRSLKVLKDGGVLVSILPVDEAAVKEAAARDIPTGFTLVEPDRLALTAIVELIEQGKLRVEIDSVYALEDAADAHRRSETGRVVGKVVLRVVEG
ncbi:MAG TPA: NADP-dependent oxidoreductase [Actinospica sp.]|jgi:NADPH:quinone reductase-like Zn-dependent oxidoreductase|nr:NADP-dependent oxidoreductase [Actinospica sp.]